MALRHRDTHARVNARAISRLAVNLSRPVSQNIHASGVEQEIGQSIAKTPQDVIEILSRAIAEISNEPDVQEKLKAQGITPDVKIKEDFDAYIRTDMARLRPVLDAIGSLKEQN